MKIQITLSLLSISLFLNNVYAVNIEIDECNQAAIQRKDALICQGRALAAKDDLNGALTVFKEAAAQSANPFDKTIATLLIGNTYKMLKQYEPAITSYQQSILNAKAAKNVAFERIGYNAIGSVYAENKQLASALEAYMQASKLAANDNERGESYENIALTHHNMNQHDLALEYQIKAYLMLSSVGTLDQYAHSSIELGRYYALTKNYISAEKTLNKIIKFAKEQGGAYYEAQGSYVLAKVKVATGDIPTAKNLIAHAKLIAKNTNDYALDEEINLETQGLF
ncbi:MAG: tetratricopeptide repeat protein [Methylotenera sp.]|nr:tetratricopeptide repeat protein [Methylotenera sp.]